MSLAFRELGDQVHCYNFEQEGVISGRDVEGGDLLSMCKVLALLTDGASLHKARYPGAHSWPPEIAGYLSYGFIPAWVSCCGWIVVSSCNVGSQLMM